MRRRSLVLFSFVVAGVATLWFSVGRAALVSSPAKAVQTGSFSGPTPLVSPLDPWLNAHPKVANALIWEIPVTVSKAPLNIPVLADANPPPSRVVSKAGLQVSYVEIQNDVDPAMSTIFSSQGFSWPQWTEANKKEVRDNFSVYSAWLQKNWPLYKAYQDSHFTQKPEGFDQAFNPEVDADPSPALNPPPNLQIDANNVDLNPNSPITVIGSQEAFHLYAKKVAFQLALAMGGYLPSITDYSENYLRELFDGRKIFRYVKPVGPGEWGNVSIRQPGYWVIPDVPGPPLMVFSYLAQHQLIGNNRTDTLKKILEWERNNLTHTFSGTTKCGKSYQEALWGYHGGPPLTTVLNGILMQCPIFYDQDQTGSILYTDKQHWTGGCGGTAGFNNLIFGYLNIASQSLAYNHFQSSFALENQTLYVDHTDNPYSLNGCDEIPTERILLDTPTFYGWFSYNTGDRSKYVGRRVSDLALEYLPLCMLKDYCELDTPTTPHDHSKLYTGFMQGSYTVQELEAMHLWEKVQDKVNSLGGCNAILHPPKP